MSAVQKFIASARQLHAEEKDAAKRWEKMTPLLQELLADSWIKPKGLTKLILGWSHWHSHSWNKVNE
jgi:hypothetical protein